MSTRKLIVYIACSLDGYIAQENDDLSFLDRVQQEGEDYGYADFVKTVDTVIMGRKTYDWIKQHYHGELHAEKDLYIITSKDRDSSGNTQFYHGDPTDLIHDLKKKNGKNIFCDGGAQLVTHLLKEKLFDEVIVSIIPVLLGGGIRLFQDNRPMQDLKLLSSQSYQSGLVQLRYQCL